MAIYFLDLENGSDAADGLSFANRWRTITSGATVARIAPGDTVRVMGSPDPTSLGIDGLWTSLPQQATAAITSSTNATPIVVTRASHGFTTGDTVVITAHTTNTNANGTWTVTVISSSTFSLDGSVGNGVGGATGTVRKINGSIITLAAPVTANIASTGNGRTAWTASANVTTSILTTDYKEGYGSDSIAIAAGFTTGLAAYKALGSAIDFSGYQQVSFWIKQTAGTLATSGQITIRLCSDAAGVTTVNTITVPAIGALSMWRMVTFNTGAALGSSIQSVALYVTTDVAAQTFLISNMIACKASSADDSLNLKSLIGKNDGLWYPIMSINGTRVMLGIHNTLIPTSAALGGYHGTSESVTTYKREPIDLGPYATATTASSTITDNGTSGNPIIFSGGWNRTDMSTQNGMTYVLSSNGNAAGILAANRSFIEIYKFGFVNFNMGISLTGTSSDMLFDEVDFIGTLTGMSVATTLGLRNSYLNINFLMCNTAITSANILSQFTNILVIGGGISTGSVSITGNHCVLDDIEIYNVGGVGLLVGSSTSASVKSTYNNLIISGAASNSIGITSSFDCKFNSTTLTGGTSASSTAISFTGVSRETTFDVITSSGHSIFVAMAGTAGEIVVLNDTVTDTTYNTNTGLYADIVLYTQNDVLQTYPRNYYDGGETLQFTNENGDGTRRWMMATLNTTRNADYPLSLPLADIVVGADALVTVKAFMMRTNSALNVSLVCKGGQILGVPNDVVASISTPTDNAYEELTITFTPTRSGKVTITAELYGYVLDQSVSIEDLTVTQA